MFNTGFNSLLPKDKAEIDLYPEELRAEIDGINDWVYDTVNSQFSAVVLKLDLMSLRRRRVQVGLRDDAFCVRSSGDPAIRLT